MWHSYVAIGDSFSEGLYDPDPQRPGSFRGWTDRLATLLAERSASEGEEFRYANLAIRGRLIADITGRQLDAALAMEPDLVSLVGGGNDLLRPGGDPDHVASQIEAAVIKLRQARADVLLATTTDTRGAGVFGLQRDKNAVLTSHIWSIARRHDAHVLDMWGLRAIQDWRLWAADRLHLTADGHVWVARQAFRALGGEPSDRDPAPLPPAEPIARIDALTANLRWTRHHALPWVHRRLTGRSSGDNIQPKRPALAPVEWAPVELG